MDTSSSPQPQPEQLRANPKRRPAVWVIIIAALIILALLVTVYLLAYTGAFFVRPDWARALGIPTATPLCARPTLSLGPASFTIEAIAQTADGSLPTPEDKSGTAWWVENTFAPFIFTLTPTADLPDLQNLIQPGDPLVVVWADCGREEFVRSATPLEKPDVSALLAQSMSGIAVIVQVDGAPLYVLLGERSGLAQPGTPEPVDPDAIQAEITFSDTSVSEDRQTITISLAIANTGSQPIFLTLADISLTGEGQTPLSPLSVAPPLPQDILPGEDLALTITFPNPGGGTAVLQVLDFAADLYY